MTLAHLRAGAVTLVLVGGLPGTGKTTLAGALADRLGFTVLSSDRIRKELAGIPAEQSCAAPGAPGSTPPPAPSGSTPSCSAAPGGCSRSANR